MFDPSSRYSKLRLKTHIAAGAAASEEGVRAIRYVERRFLPPLDASVPLVEHIVADGDRLDNVTAKHLGDPTQFWRVADANDALRPEELTAEPGRGVVVALPRL